MKKTIRQLKRAVNFAKHSFGYDNRYDKEADDIGKSNEELLTNKCEIINYRLFGADYKGKSQSHWKNPYNLIKFLGEIKNDYERNPNPDTEEVSEICEHLRRVINSLMPEPILSRLDVPESLAVRRPIDILIGKLNRRNQLQDFQYIPLADTAKNESLLDAVEAGDVSLVKQLLREGASPDAQCPHDKRPIWEAVESGNVEIVRLLLEAGVSELRKLIAMDNVENGDVDMAETIAKFMTPQELTNAFISRVDRSGSFSKNDSDTTILEVLLQSGADINGYEYDNHNALESALTGDNPDIVRFLLNNGANPNNIIEAYSNKLPALLFAIEFSNVPYDIIKLMIAKGADVNLADKNGVTPLMEAVSQNKKQIAKLLISAGADINAVNKAGKRVIDYAWKRQDPTQALRKYLLSLGAKE